MVAVIIVKESIIEHILITYMPNQEGPLYCPGDSKEYILTVEEVKVEETMIKGLEPCEHRQAPSQNPLLRSQWMLELVLILMPSAATN